FACCYTEVASMACGYSSRRLSRRCTETQRAISPAACSKPRCRDFQNDVNLFPGASLRWALAYMLNVEGGPNGRSAGTGSWGGLFNTYYWLDPARKVTGLIMTQVLPFADQRVLKR